MNKNHEHPILKFPPGFLWGSAASAHQVEGGNDKNDWSEWEKEGGRIADGSLSGRAADHYKRYGKDFKLARENNQNAHRLSLEWSRIEPKEEEWDEKEIAHYKDVLRELKGRYFTVMLTLHHFTLPKWLADQGGWESKKAVKAFLRFAEKAADEFGGLADIWVTINEPIIYITQSYIYGVWPPGKKSILAGLRVFGNLALAHCRAYKILHRKLDGQAKKAQVGIAKNAISFEPYRKHALGDRIFVRFADWLWNHRFFSKTKGCHDFIGINYYFHYRVKFVPADYGHFFFEVRNENREMSDVGWEVFPPGLFQVLQDMAVYKKPIYITENGIASLNDDKRIRFIVSHLKEVYHAIQSGVDVRGYFYWSLLDNFEWEKGFGPRFGLIEIDYATLGRKPRQSLAVYGRIAREGGIHHDLMRYLGHEA